MSVSWTEDQKKVIDTRGCSILVSAAAGSGKTAVLVERILQKILDRQAPLDVDRLLVMTFTRAAAQEMKERLTRAIQKALYQNPDDPHLLRQMTLVHTAQITTIHGFCAYIIRNYFHLIDLDPGWRIADEAEMSLLKEDVLSEVLEEAYEDGSEDFTRFVEAFCPGKNDAPLEEAILRLYEFSESDPDPEAWLSGCTSLYRADALKEGENASGNPFLEALFSQAESDVREAMLRNRECLSIAGEPQGPWMYGEALAEDQSFAEKLMFLIRGRDYNAVCAALASFKAPALSRKTDKMVRDDLKEDVKDIRNEYKELMKGLKERLFPASLEEIAVLCEEGEKRLAVLVSLTGAFRKKLEEKKREKNILDFGDLEHLSLSILTGEDGLSEAARELSQKYDEVMIDEYQDSNLVQERIAQCVSGWAKNKKNIFMVGDVKQSIYRFRMARPELFMGKYKTFKTDLSAEEVRINLSKNFRSRQEVVRSVNYLFERLMGEDLGGIVYDADAKLYPGADFPAGGKEDFHQTEVWAIDGEGLPEEEKGSRKKPRDAREVEALFIAQRILAIEGKELVYDKDEKAYRPARFGDMVILLRSTAGWSEVFSEVLQSKGIPCYSASRTGYFGATEVRTVLNYLRILDNPRQDIPLQGVLLSPIGGFSPKELAAIRATWPDGQLLDSLKAFLAEGKSEALMPEAEWLALYEKARIFWETYQAIRASVPMKSVHEIIDDVLSKTGYASFARVLPGGAQRSANLSMLGMKAMEYEKTSYRGLYSFIRYIDRMEKYELDFGEVNLSGAGDGSVQIMTVHKSKGLEFPIVFVAGLSKTINMMDARSNLLIHPDLGLGVDIVYPKERLRFRTIQKAVISRRILSDSLGEELRVLYVALTRAKEKLILTALRPDLSKDAKEAARLRKYEEPLLPLGVRTKAKSWWDFILAALSRHRCLDELLREEGVSSPKGEGEKRDFQFGRVSLTDLVSGDVAFQTGTEMKKQLLEEKISSGTGDAGLREAIQSRFSFDYPYERLAFLPFKVSVSEIKKRYIHEEEMDTWQREDYGRLSGTGGGKAAAGNERSDAFEGREHYVPRFIEEREETKTGSFRGSAYHRLMECLDYARCDTDEEVRAQIRELTEKEKLEPEEADAINIRDIRTFLNTPLGGRMKQAFLRGSLTREQPFVLAEKARDVLPGPWEEESVLVQGIIDAFFIEDGEVVLVDYKTDRVGKGGEKALLSRYQNQLKDYREALTRLLGCPVKETYIYSFALRKEIAVTF